MENKENIVCSLCHKQFQISHGDYLFTYNAQCINNHKFENIEIDDLLEKKENNISIYQCKDHQKMIMAHCFLCNEDICFKCVNASHKSHKIEYLKSLLNMETFIPSHFKYIFEKENKIINIFLSELKLFQNKLNTYINNIKTQIIKEIKFREEIVNKLLSKVFTYIDLQNVKTILINEQFTKINDNINKFCNSKSFIEKYDYMRNIFNEGIQRGKYLENLNLLNVIKKFGINIIPLNKNYFINILKDDYKHWTILQIIKDNSDKYLKELKYNILSEKSFNFSFDKIFIKNNINIDEELLFYTIDNIFKDNLLEVKILNVLDKDKIKYETKEIFFNKTIFIYGLIFLDINKNIIFDEKGEISLYDDLFNKIKKLDSISISNDFKYLKINENTFVYTTGIKNDIYVASIDNNEFNKYEIQNCGNIFINYFQKKKILISHDKNNLYLINFNSLFPEVIQKVQIDNYKTKFTYFEQSIYIEGYNFFKDDSVYIRYVKQKSFENNYFYLVYYIIQYKIDDVELKEVSRIEEKREKLLFNE